MVTVKPPVNAHRPVIVRTTSNNNESTGAFVVVLGLMVVMCVGVVVCSLPSRPPSVSSYDPSHVRHVVEETTYQSVDPPQASAPYYDVPVAPPPPPPMYQSTVRRRYVEQPVNTVPVVSRYSAESAANQAYTNGMVAGAVLNEVTRPAPPAPTFVVTSQPANPIVYDYVPNNSSSSTTNEDEPAKTHTTTGYGDSESR